MARVVHSGNLQRYSGGPFGGASWTHTYVEVLEDGNVRWFDKKGDSKPKHMVNLRFVSTYLALGRIVERVPCRPTDVPANSFDRMIGIPHENEKSTPVTFFLCNDDNEMKTWCDALMRVLQVAPPQAAPLQGAAPGLQVPMNNMGQRQSSAPNLAAMPPSYPTGAPPPYAGPSGGMPPYPQQSPYGYNMPPGPYQAAPTPFYPPGPSYPPTTGFPPQQPAYPPQQGAYPTQPGGYPTQPYPTQAGVYPAQQYAQYAVPSTSQGTTNVVLPPQTVYVTKKGKNKNLKKGAMGLVAGAAGLYVASKVMHPYHHHHYGYGGGWGWGHHGSWGSWSSGSWSWSD